MPGVKEVDQSAFYACDALVYIEWGNLEIIRIWAFGYCTSLNSTDLPSIRIVEGFAFNDCKNLENVKFAKDLESIRDDAFCNCWRLQRITLPLKDGMVIDDNTFQRCVNLNRVDLVGGVHEIIDSLLIEEWKNDMNEEIDTINQILPNTPAGNMMYENVEKAKAIRAWINTVLRKIIHYKSEHRRILNEAAAILQPALPNDIVLKNVLPFLELPSYTFDGED